MLRWASENLLQLKPEEIGEHYGRYRLHVPEAERAMVKSLERYGQLSPVVVCRRDNRPTTCHHASEFGRHHQICSGR